MPENHWSQGLYSQTLQNSGCNLNAHADELSNHYGVKINYTSAPYPPDRLRSTNALLDDEVDIVSQINAMGGETQELRRRILRRSSCTDGCIIAVYPDCQRQPAGW